MVDRYDFWIKRYARCPALTVYYGIYSTPILSLLESLRFHLILLDEFLYLLEKGVMKCC